MRRLLLALLLLLGARPAAAHTRLVRSTPGAGDTLTTAPAELRLVFSEAVAARYTTLILRSPAGDVVPLAELVADPLQHNRELFVPSPALTRYGTYRVEWKTAAADGHVVNGSFQFTLLPPSGQGTLRQGGDSAGAPVEGTTADTAGLHQHHVDESALPPVFRQGSALNVLARALQFAALIALIGAAVFRTLLLRDEQLDGASRAELRARSRRYAALALSLFLVLMPLRLWLQSAAIHGPELAREPMLVGSYLTEMRWGQAWLAQLVITTFATIALFTGFTPLLALSAMLLAFTFPFQGHAAAVEHLGTLAIAADGLHLLAAGAWIGTLAILLLLAIPVLWRSRDAAGALAVARVIGRFSPVALTAAAILAISGLGSALFHIHSVSDLFHSTYGRVLLLKLGLVALVLASGWYNWRRARPGLALQQGVANLRRAAALELFFAGAAVAVTAVLVALPTP